MKKLCMMLLLAVTAVSAFAFTACRKEEKTGNENIVVLNDFEEYATGFEPLVLANYFGKVSVNTDQRYVASGRQSARLVPSGDPTEQTSARPTLRQPLHVLKANKNYTDLGKIKMISVEIYNSEPREVPMEVQLQFKSESAESRAFVLKSGWNTVAYAVHAGVLNFSYDIASCMSVSFVFDLPVAGENAPVLYADDIVLHLETEDFKSQPLDLAENEVLSFDKPYQEYVLRPIERLPQFAPRLSLNANPRFSKSGCSLKVEMPATDGTLPPESYTGFDIMAKYMSNVGMEKYGDDDVFSFWVYNANTVRQRLFLELSNKNNNKFFFKDAGLYIEPLSWKQFTYKFSDLNKGQLASDGTKAMGKIYISWKISDMERNRVLYFDSFEVIRNA